MKRILALALVLSPLAACGCGNSYDKYRSERPRYSDADEFDTRDTSDGERSRSHARPGAQVIYSSELQGGYGPGSYGGRSSTVITPREDGTVQVDGESDRR